MYDVYVFDLDDTLLYYKRGFVVPRQTHHFLRDLWARGKLIIIVSYNPLVKALVRYTELSKYCKHVFYGEESRYDLVKEALEGAKANGSVVYFDDRHDNIVDVKRLGIDCFHVKSALTLYQQINRD